MSASQTTGDKRVLLKRLLDHVRLEHPVIRKSVFGFIIGLTVFLFIVAPMLGDIVPPMEAVKVVVGAMLFLLIVVAEHVAEQGKESGIQVFPQEDYADDRQRQIIETKPKEVKMCEYSAWSVNRLLKKLGTYPETKAIKLLICHPKKGLTESQKTRILGSLQDLSTTPYRSRNRLPDTLNLRVRCYSLPASLRGRNFDNKHIVLGWYTYDCEEEKDEAVQIWGTENPVLVAPTHDKDGEKLVDMFNSVFDTLWEHSATLKDALADPELSRYDHGIRQDWVEKVSQADPAVK